MSPLNTIAAIALALLALSAGFGVGQAVVERLAAPILIEWEQ